MNNGVSNLFNSKNKQRFFLLATIIGVMIVIIFAISFSVKLIGIKIPYEELEKKLESAAEKYMNDNLSNLPSEENPITVVSGTTLIEGKYIKELKKYVKDASCTANVNVYYTSGKYEYQAFLTCNEFKTERLIDTLKRNNEISSFGEGLYDMNEELVYRGQNPNNYIKFADELWRIVKVNNKGQILFIKNETEYKYDGVWDDRYNTETDSQKGINTFSLSRALSNIRTIYQENYYSNQKYLSSFSICSGKRNELDMSKNGATECSNLLENQYIGLLPIYDYMNASLDNLCINIQSEECQNYNYLANSEDSWWTATGDTQNTYDVYFIDSSGEINVEDASYSKNYRFVLALNKNILYKSGTGTEKDPYIIR